MTTAPWTALSVELGSLLAVEVQSEIQLTPLTCVAVSRTLTVLA